MKLYERIKTNEKKAIRLVGSVIYERISSSNQGSLKIFFVPLYKKINQGGLCEVNYFGGIIKTVRNEQEIKYYFLGIKIFRKKRSIDAVINYNKIAVLTQRIITTAILHQKTFPAFKGCNRGKDVVLVAAGPTVNDYIPIKNAVHVGCNRAFKRTDIHFDYLFAIDKVGLLDYAEDFFAYKCPKFVGDQNSGIHYQLPEEYSLRSQVYRYKTNVGGLPCQLYLDIDSAPLANACSVTVQAMQFILYTQPKRVYLVGIDCTSASRQYFTGVAYDVTLRGGNAAASDKKNILFWGKIKTFAKTYYPNTEIISVNPVGLKGIFKDVYTQSYLKEHPEIDGNKHEIIQEEKIM